MKAFIDTILDILAALLRAVGLRRPGRRREIRANLELLEELESIPEFDAASDGRKWLVAHTTIEIARFVGVPIPGSRKPIEWGSVVLGIVLGGPTGYWAYALDSSSFTGWSVPLALWSAFCLLGGPIGQVFFRDRVPAPELPGTEMPEEGANPPFGTTMSPDPPAQP